MKYHLSPTRLLARVIATALLLTGLWLPSNADTASRLPETTAPATFSCGDVTEIPQVECEALVALYNHTNGPYWYRQAGWLSTNMPCSWEGITCKLGHVSAIDLGDYPDQYGLSGNLPPDLGSLTNLESLDLSFNEFHGAIPPELGGLTNLVSLDLNTSFLREAIPPELGNLRNLRSLNLGQNLLIGAIPPELGRLGALEVLDLWRNDLTGTIPPELGNLTALKNLYLPDNDLTGAIPPQLANLTNLITLSLYYNDLTGAIPSWVGNLVNLRRLELGGNDLTGSIPPELGDLGNLDVLFLGESQLTGAIPPELGNLANIKSLFLNDNQLTGPIPAELGGLPALKYLTIDRNLLSGPLPSTLTALNLAQFWYDKTDLCEPGDAAYQNWLAGIAELKRTAMVCGTHRVHGVVWYDQNRDGIQNADEPPLPGITVALAANAGSQLSVAAGRQVASGQDGSYRFEFVAPGAYTLSVSSVAGYFPVDSNPVAISVPAEGDVIVPPIGLTRTLLCVYLPLIRR